MKLNIFDQSTEAGRSRLNIVQLGIYVFGLGSTCLAELFSLTGILPLTLSFIGIPTAILTGALAFFSFIALVGKIVKHTQLEKPAKEKYLVTRNKKYSVPNNEKTSLLTSSDEVGIEVG